MKPVEFAHRVIGWNRTLSSALTPRLARTNLNPNQITTLSLAAGFAAAICFSRSTRADFLIGAGLLQLSFVLDNCDGAVARLKGLSSAFGMWYDFVCDLLVDFAVWAGLAVGARAQGQGPWVYGLAAAAALASFLNFLRVTSERTRTPEKKPGVPRPGALAAIGGLFDALSHDGDPTLFIWVLAAAGRADLYLALGAGYMYVLWLVAVIRSARPVR
ncbi:MAG TPA: CDP-alcohol phosphatidyltransferase family protein [Candidatus Eisenbacteria bacterium]|nr:CDP-alcohol phosphatidyltransferase family protein [Candidatus Eisenbacteria bacterium]